MNVLRLLKLYLNAMFGGKKHIVTNIYGPKSQKSLCRGPNPKIIPPLVQCAIQSYCVKRNPTDIVARPTRKTNKTR
jgi:hypothetical protein